MRAIFEKVERDPASSFRIMPLKVRSFEGRWHFHPEYELTLILKSRGRRFVGDSIERFQEGDLVLIGPNLPHFWVSDQGTKRAEAVVIQFLEDFAGGQFFSIPEVSELEGLLERSNRGLHFRGKIALKGAKAIAELPRLKGIQRFTRTLEILCLLASARDARPLSSPLFRPVLDLRASERINRACRYVFDHFLEPIGLKEIAAEAGMSPAAFSRYFKRMTGRNVVTLLSQTRLGHATRLLLDTEWTVARICFESGFNNISNFNRQFLALHGTTPSQWRAKHASNAPKTALEQVREKAPRDSRRSY